MSKKNYVSCTNMSEMKPVDDFDIVTYRVVNVNDPNSEPLFHFLYRFKCIYFGFCFVLFCFVVLSRQTFNIQTGAGPCHKNRGN